MLSKVRFPTKLNTCRLKILVPKIIIYYGKKRGVACSIYILHVHVGVYQTFKHGMFRVSGSCKLRILCAQFFSIEFCPLSQEGNYCQRFMFFSTRLGRFACIKLVHQWPGISISLLITERDNELYESNWKYSAIFGVKQPGAHSRNILFKLFAGCECAKKFQKSWSLGCLSAN